MQSTLKESGRGATSGRGQRRLRSVLVVAEVALAVVLTLGAGLLLRSFLSVLSIDPGFQPDRLLTLQIALPNNYQTPDQRRALYATLFSRLDALPGVTSVGGTTRLPLGSTNVSTKVDVEGRGLPPGEWPEVEFRRAVHNYFPAMGIPILRGRGFTDQDGPSDAAGDRHQPDDGAEAVPAARIPWAGGSAPARRPARRRRRRRRSSA